MHPAGATISVEAYMYLKPVITSIAKSSVFPWPFQRRGCTSRRPQGSIPSFQARKLVVGGGGGGEGRIVERAFVSQKYEYSIKKKYRILSIICVCSFLWDELVSTQNIGIYRLPLTF